jgi:hypothetical protein
MVPGREERFVMRRVLLVLAVVAATTVMAVPAGADPASAQCPTTDGTHTGVRVTLSDTPVTVSVTDTRTGDLGSVVVTFTDGGTRFRLTAPDEQRLVVADASWCVKAAKGNTSPVVGTGSSGASAASNKKGELLRIDYVTVFSVDLEPSVVICLDSTTPGVPDAQPVGPFDSTGNLAVFASTDGTCSGENPVRRTMVSATTVSDANTTCLALGAPGVDATLAGYGYPLPDHLWVCTPV